MAAGADEELAWLDRIAARGALADYHHLPAARADLLRRAGRAAEARTAYERALALARNPAEQAYLRRRPGEL